MGWLLILNMDAYMLMRLMGWETIYLWMTPMFPRCSLPLTWDILLMKWFTGTPGSSYLANKTQPIILQRMGKLKVMVRHIWPRGYKKTSGLWRRLFKAGGDTKKNIWPMAQIIQGLTADSQEEKLQLLDMLVNTDGGTGRMHESYNPDYPERFTRSWYVRNWCSLCLDIYLV
mmetsp:Transcript_1650/g.2486  ORF Transcript_1650/g.2486 Transcript_1650/m.2486 type:complete len:172 (-) Transcript_1650:17-532(-)